MNKKILTVLVLILVAVTAAFEIHDQIDSFPEGNDETDQRN